MNHPRREMSLFTAQGSALAGALGLCAALAACTERDATPPGTSAGSAGASYAIQVKGPPRVAPGAPSIAEVSVTPKGEYKMNLDFPMKLSIKAPAGAAPRALEMKAKDAAKFTEAVLLLRPQLKLQAAGKHQVQGALRFSVCTKKQCEVKTEQVKWVAESQ